MVGASQVREARLKLASQGLPESSNSGLDLLNKDSGIGVSQFMETARYQYALETELARTITTIKSVVAARVHLAITQQSAFIRDRRPVTASVLVQLRAGGRLEPGQVQAIVQQRCLACHTGEVAQKGVRLDSATIHGGVGPRKNRRCHRAPRRRTRNRRTSSASCSAGSTARRSSRLSNIAISDRWYRWATIRRSEA